MLRLKTIAHGFLEKVYENAMFLELRRMGLKVERQKNIKVYYDSYEIGDYYADLLINDLVIIELKAAESICREYELQLITHLTQNLSF